MPSTPAEQLEAARWPIGYFRALAYAPPANIGLNMYQQWAVIDRINALGIVVSDAGRATIDL